MTLSWQSLADMNPVHWLALDLHAQVRVLANSLAIKSSTQVYFWPRQEPYQSYPAFKGLSPALQAEYCHRVRTCSLLLYRRWRIDIASKDELQLIFQHSFDWRVNKLLVEIEAVEGCPSMTLHSLATGVDVGIDRLGRLFKRDVGCSFKEYAIRIRQLNIGIALGNPHERIKNIAASIGYKDLPTFFKEFRNWYGLTPKAMAKLLFESDLKIEAIRKPHQLGSSFEKKE